MFIFRPRTCQRAALFTAARLGLQPVPRSRTQTGGAAGGEAEFRGGDPPGYWGGSAVPRKGPHARPAVRAFLAPSCSTDAPRRSWGRWGAPLPARPRLPSGAHRHITHRQAGPSLPGGRNDVKVHHMLQSPAPGPCAPHQGEAPRTREGADLGAPGPARTCVSVA